MKELYEDIVRTNISLAEENARLRAVVKVAKSGLKQMLQFDRTSIVKKTIEEIKRVQIK